MKSIFGFGAAGLGNLDLSVLGLGSTIAATALVTTLSQPAWAAATRITGVEVNDTDSGIELLLMQARSGDRPQVFSVERGNSWVADIINSELALPSGGSFQSMNPAPGIASVQVVPLDANSVRVIVTGESGAPAGELTTRSAQGLAFNFDASGGGSAAAPRSSTAPAAASTTVAQGSGANPDVLVPNPEITITGGQPTAIPRANPAPPFLPRAVAPPLGDIAVSELTPQATSVDLGTVERVPHLVLRDAPAREVLALLARAAGLNIAFIGGSAGEGEGAAAGEGPIVRALDIEGEPVQDVFNYVLRLTNLQAVRQGRTILVGPELPAVRTLRVNQAEATGIVGLLAAQGAAGRQVTTVTDLNIADSSEDIAIGAAGTGGVAEAGGGEMSTGQFQEPTTTTTTTTVTSIDPPTVPEGLIIPQPLRGLTATADDRLNQVTLVGRSDLIELATSFIRQADLRVRQAMINVKVVDVNLLNTQLTGTSFSFGIDDTFVVSDGNSAAINFGQYGVATTALPASSRFLASLQAQVVSNNAKILTDPTLLVQEGSSAIVNLTEEVFAGFRQQAVTGENGVVSVVQNPVTEPVGLSLAVVIDRIDDNGFITLQVNPTVSSVSGFFDVPDSDSNAVLTAARAMKSGVIRLRDGQTLVIAGIIQDQDREEVSKWPILGDLPIIGALFRRTNSTRERNEVVIVITPQILDDSDRAGYGYSYTPSPSVQDMINRSR